MPTLRVARGRSTAEEFRFTDEAVIGRAEDCDVRVFDEAASRCHAIIRREGEVRVVGIMVGYRQGPDGKLSVVVPIASPTALRILSEAGISLR